MIKPKNEFNLHYRMGSNVLLENIKSKFKIFKFFSITSRYPVTIILSYYHIKLRSDKHICLRESSNRVKFSIWVQCFYSASTTRVAVVPDFSSRDCHAHSPVSYCRPAASTMGGVAEAFHLGYLVSFVCLSESEIMTSQLRKFPIYMNFLHFHRFSSCFSDTTRLFQTILVLHHPAGPPFSSCLHFAC